MNNSTQATPSIGIKAVWTMLMSALLDIISLIPQATQEAKGAMDIISDVRKTAKVYSNALLAEADITASDQLSALEQASKPKPKSKKP